jgi:parallel beta-helix repeat protein
MKKQPASRRSRRSAFDHRLTFEPLESRLLLSVSPTSIDDQITLEGSHLTVLGTDGQDSFEVVIGSEYGVTLNGSTRTFDAASIDKITVVADNEDTVTLHDTAGDDSIYGSPEQIQVVADGLTLEAFGAGDMVVVADAGGVDEAHLSDSSGDDLFVSDPQSSTLSGDGFSIRVESVEYVHGYARAGGNDQATICGSDGDESYVGKETWGRLSGDGYALRAKFFDVVTVHAGGGTDEAKLRDSAGDDTFHATPTEATMLGDGYTHRVVGFDGVHAYARAGGYDIANLHDSSGDDTYVATDTWGKLYGDDFLVRAKFFDSVHAYADAGGYDTAQLNGTSGTDTFESRPTHSWLRGDGYEHRVGAFDYVYAKASTGPDEALIYDSDGTDLVVAEERSVTLTEDTTGTVRQALGFNTVTTRLQQETDQVVVAEEPDIELRIERPGDETVVYAADYLDANSPTWGIQDAIDALPEEGGVVILPEGTFTLRQGLLLRDGVTLRGAGDATVLMRPDHEETRLTITAATGATYVEVESTDGFQVGDDISVLAYGQSNVAHHTIVKIEPGKIYLDVPIAVSGTYAPDDTASVVNYFPLIRTAWDYEGIVTADVVVEELILDGNMDESTEAWRVGAPSLLHLEGAVDAVVRNVTARNANAGGILLIGGHDNLIENVTVEKVRGHGIFTFEEADTIISAATVRQAGYATRGVSGDGIFVVGSSDIRVENSLVEGSLRHGLHPGGDLNRGGVWINNTSRDNGSNGFHFCWDNFDMVVTGNVLEDNGRYGVGGLGLGGEFGDCFNTVSDNLIRGNAREGIQVNGGSYNTIVGNTIVDNSLLGTGRFSGILLGNASFVVVADNTIGTATGQATQKYGVEEYGTANENLIVGNDTSGNVEGGIYLTGSATTVEDNTGSIHSEDN